jgi:hypothetical protein
VSHRILLRTFIVDVPSDTHDQAVKFWASALAATPRTAPIRPEYSFLDGASPSNRIIFQRLESGPARIHFDIHTDDVNAEVDRLLDCGATLIERYGPTEDQSWRWVVMQDPAGLPFCVVWALGEYRPEAEREDFLSRAKEVG